MAQAWDDRFEKVLREAVPALPADTPLLPDLQLIAAGLDSVGIVKLMMRLEQEYRTEFAFELLNFQIFSTPATLWDAVSGALARTGTAGTDA
ncbi:acyl carrier protein [Solihabitans fulvus]|uniref:acyl carrier protein n=1 Tax=Solihabitans fulvus TaxID=1892852 RepID=UPI001661E8A3|nr:phosphopantetheine-binding protein [Solihabitans fulvus]